MPRSPPLNRLYKVTSFNLCTKEKFYLMSKPANLRSRIIFALLKVYKSTLSPVFYALGVRCRFEPSCSVYMAKSISAHGVWTGAWLGLARLSRCHPFSACGHDPVPETLAGNHPLLPWLYGKWFTEKREPSAEHEAELAIANSDETNKKKQP